MPWRSESACMIVTLLWLSVNLSVTCRQQRALRNSYLDGGKDWALDKCIWVVLCTRLLVDVVLCLRAWEGVARTG